MNKILLTGGSGLLGSRLIKLFLESKIDFIAPSHSDLDLTDASNVNRFSDYSLIIHCAACTDIREAQRDRKRCYEVNVIGTRNLAHLCIPMIYISTDGVFDGVKGNYIEEDYPNPVNFYGMTKLLGEYEAEKTESIIIRTSFKPIPFEHSRACTDMYTSGDYVDVIADKIMFVINHKEYFSGIIHVGTKRKSIYELAIKTNPKVRKITRNMLDVPLPWDISLNTSLFDSIYAKITRK